MEPYLYDRLFSELHRLSSSKKVDGLPVLMQVLSRVMDAQAEMSVDIRPHDSRGRGGGLLLLDRALPLLVLPDLHARRDFLMALLDKKLDSGGTVLEALARKELQILCVGDGFHSEGRGLKRWQEALREYKEGFRKHRAMDMEMAESLGLMEMVMLLQGAFPSHFFFLKGNHENILNEEGDGNHPFGKYVHEGEMVKAWAMKFLGESFLYSYAEYEKSLPYLAVAESLLISHAEPESSYELDEIIDIYRLNDVKLGLTWTGNEQAEEGSVEDMLTLWSREFCRIFSHHIGGHRSIKGLYKLRAEGHYVQIHNPLHRIVLFTDQRSPFEPERNIVDLEQIRRFPL